MLINPLVSVHIKNVFCVIASPAGAWQSQLFVKVKIALSAFGLGAMTKIISKTQVFRLKTQDSLWSCVLCLGSDFVFFLAIASPAFDSQNVCKNLNVQGGRNVIPSGIEESDNSAILPYYNEPLREFFY